jgi:hypothetical protein
MGKEIVPAAKSAIADRRGIKSHTILPFDIFGEIL